MINDHDLSEVSLSELSSSSFVFFRNVVILLAARVRVKVWAVAAVPGGVASGGADSAVRLWTSTLEPRGTLGTHTTWVVCLCWGGTELLSSSGAERGFERVFF